MVDRGEADGLREVALASARRAEEQPVNGEVASLDVLEVLRRAGLRG